MEARFRAKPDANGRVPDLSQVVDSFIDAFEEFAWGCTAGGPETRPYIDFRSDEGKFRAKLSRGDLEEFRIVVEPSAGVFRTRPDRGPREARQTQSELATLLREKFSDVVWQERTE